MKRIVLFGALMVSISMLFGCSKKEENLEVTLSVRDHFENTMMSIEEYEQQKEQETEPVYDSITAKKGTEISYGIVVDEVAEDSVTIKIDQMDFYCTVYDIDTGEAVKNYENPKKVVIKKGQELDLTDTGILDASHNIYIAFD